MSSLPIHPSVSVFVLNTAVTNISCVLVHVGGRRLRGTRPLRQTSSLASGGDLSQRQVGEQGEVFLPAAKFINVHEGVRPGYRLWRHSAGIWVCCFSSRRALKLTSRSCLEIRAPRQRQRSTWMSIRSESRMMLSASWSKSPADKSVF